MPVIDVHAHVMVPEVESLVSGHPERRQEAARLASWMGAASGDHNRSLGPGYAPKFADLRVRFVAGTEDPAHTREIDTRTVELLRSWGADAELVFLGDRGVDGNGHFLFHETNSDELLELVRAEIEA